MSFMQQEITECQEWYQVDGNAGTEFIPADIVRWNDGTMEDMIEAVRDYYPGSTIYSVEEIKGYGARLSASGYLDCTDWSVFETEDEAQEYLEEMYGDEELDD